MAHQQDWQDHESEPQYLSFYELFQNLLRIVLERSFLIFCLFVLAVGSALYYVTTAKPIYEASVVLEVQQQEESQVEMDSTRMDDLSRLDVVKTIEQSLQRISLFMQVLQRPDIKGKPEALVGLIEADRSTSDRQMAEALADDTSVSLKKGTRLIYVTVEHQVPEMSQILANAIVDQFIQERSGIKSGTSTQATTFLADQSAQLKEELQAAENAVQLYASAIQVRDRLKQQLSSMEVLRQRYRAKHPRMIQAEALLASMRSEFDSELLKIRSGKKEEDAYWQAQQAEWGVALNEDSLSYKLRSLEARYNVLSRELETVRQLYDSLTRQMRETDVSRQADPTELQVIESALLPQKPSKPKKLLILVAAALLGLGAGVALAVVLDALDQTLRTVDAAERFTAQSVIAVLPKRRGFSKKRQLSLILDPDSDLAEGLRTLRTSLELKSRKHQWKTYLFTSSIPGEGKSFTSANLAVACSQQHLKTLLIDADLRRPVMEEFMPQVRNKPGLHDVLIGGATAAEAIQAAEGSPDLYLLSAGSRCPNPAELLSEKKVKELLETLSRQFDRIIIDSAPVNSVSDTLLLAPFADAVCLVVKASATPKRAVRRALQLLHQNEVPFAGVVLNQVPRRSGIGSDPYHYHYSSAKGYGKVYGS